MTTSTRLASWAVLLLSLACGTKPDVPPAEGETGTPTIQAAPGDIASERAAVSDTTPGIPAAPLSATGAAPTPSASATKGGSIIGYDSAFGPSYELDSTGRPIPLKKRKP